jgi:hypothetical protein
MNLRVKKDFLGYNIKKRPVISTGPEISNYYCGAAGGYHEH